MHVDFVVNLVEKSRVPISAAVVVQGTMLLGTIVPRQDFDDWLLAQFAAALESFGYNVTTASTPDDADAPVVQGNANDRDTFAMKDVTVRSDQAVYHLPFVSVSLKDVAAFTVGKFRS
jgi:hypothetical protein